MITLYILLTAVSCNETYAEGYEIKAQQNIIHLGYQSLKDLKEMLNDSDLKEYLDSPVIFGDENENGEKESSSQVDKEENIDTLKTKYAQNYGKLLKWAIWGNLLFQRYFSATDKLNKKLDDFKKQESSREAIEKEKNIIDSKKAQELAYLNFWFEDCLRMIKKLRKNSREILEELRKIKFDLESEENKLFKSIRESTSNSINPISNYFKQEIFFMDIEDDGEHLDQYRKFLIDPKPENPSKEFTEIESGLVEDLETMVENQKKENLRKVKKDRMKEQLDFLKLCSDSFSELKKKAKIFNNSVSIADGHLVKALRTISLLAVNKSGKKDNPLEKEFNESEKNKKEFKEIFVSNFLKNLRSFTTSIYMIGSKFEELFIDSSKGDKEKEEKLREFNEYAEEKWNWGIRNNGSMVKAAELGLDLVSEIRKILPEVEEKGTILKNEDLVKVEIFFLKCLSMTDREFKKFESSAKREFLEFIKNNPSKNKNEEVVVISNNPRRREDEVQCSNIDPASCLTQNRNRKESAKEGN